MSSITPQSIGMTTYREGNGSVPLVLIHGFPVDHRMWDGVAADFAELTAGDEVLEKMPILAVDMPGAGDNPLPAEGSFAAERDGAYPDALDAMTSAFVAKVHDAGYERAVWIGLSMGGYVIFAVQRLFPEAVAGLGVLDSKPDADTAASRTSRLGIARDAEAGAGWHSVEHFAVAQPRDSEVKKSDEYRHQMLSWLQDQTAAGIAWRERMAAGRPDQSDVLPSISAPLLVLSGELDPSSPPTVMRPIADAVPSAFFVEVPQAGHFTAVEQPQAVARALVDLAHAALN